MRLQQLNRNEDKRRIQAAAGVAGILGLAAIVQSVINGLADGFGAGAAVGIVVGIVYLALAYGTWRGSWAAAAGALGLFVASELMVVAAVGLAALISVWFWIGAAVLASGVQAARTEHRARAAEA